MKELLKFIKEEWWLGLMLVGMCLLTWSISQGGELFTGQTILACAFIILGVGIGTTDKN